MRTHVVLAILLLVSTAGAKDLVIRQRTTGGFAGATPSEETVYLTGDKIATDSRAARTVVDLDRRTITAADKAKKTYTVMTFDELTAQMDMLRSSLDKLPPEARKQMGALFDEGEPVAVKQTGKTAEIAGYTATEYVLSGGPYSGSVWTTDAIPTPATFQKWKGIEQSRGGAARRLGDAMSQIKGFPLRTRIETRSSGQTMVLSNEVLEVKEAGAPPEMLAPPAGFAKQAIPAPPGPGAR